MFESDQESTSRVETRQQNPYLIPAAIVVAGALIAVAVFVSNGGLDASQRAGVVVGASENDAFENNNSANAENLRPISAGDHIRGDINARVALVEFSDFECPFCQRFHGTMQQVLQEYPNDVIWVYRHFPLTEIHSNAQQAAVASECIAEAGGNDAFWTYTDKVFENQSRLGVDLYQEIARDLGLNIQQFNACLDSGKFDERVSGDVADATGAGGRGTPYNVVVTRNGEMFPFSGALPYDQVKAIIDRAIATLD